EVLDALREQSLRVDPELHLVQVLADAPLLRGEDEDVGALAGLPRVPEGDLVELSELGGALPQTEEPEELLAPPLDVALLRALALGEVAGVLALGDDEAHRLRRRVLPQDGVGLRQAEAPLRDDRLLQERIARRLHELGGEGAHLRL